MNELLHIFERLDLQQYVENFVEEGFDTWETVLYITESDLDALNVKLGHRRKLQREIAHARGMTFDQLLALTSHSTSNEPASSRKNRQASDNPSESRTTPPAPAAKRKYRRHPKPDENAPERPPSAYVIFSNKIRDELKPMKLSFTEIAKAVGEKWQSLPPIGKEPYESQAASGKEVYLGRLVEYKRTLHYAEYMQYLSNFKAKYAAPSADNKRARLETESSAGSTGSLSSMPSSSGGFERHRHDSMSGAAGTSPSESAVGSPIYNLPRALAPLSNDPSSPSSTSTTPISSTYPRLSAGSQNTPQPSRGQQLPRIVPLDHRDHSGMQTNLPPMVTDNHPLRTISNRRSANAQPNISLLRHDTSKSSVSSTISNNTSASTGSSAYTPVTPGEEGRPKLASQSQGTSMSSIESRAGDSGRPFTLPPFSSYTTQDGNSPTHPPSQFYHTQTQPMPSSSVAIEGRQQDLPMMQQRPFLQQRPRSDPHEVSQYPPPRNQRSVSTQPDSIGSERQDEERSNVQASSRPDRMDALSVLALAGNMVDRDDKEKDNAQS